MKTQNQSGFTLLELLLYTAIASIMVTAISTTFVLSIQSRIKNQTIAEVEQQGAAAMELITYEIRNADALVTPANAGDSGASLVLTAQDSDTITIDVDGDDALQITDSGTATTTEITSSRVNISGMTFTNLTPSGAPASVRIEYTVIYDNTQGRNEYSYTKNFIATANLRE